MLSRLAIAIAFGFALIPVWRTADSTFGRYAVIAGLAAGFFMIATLADWIGERRRGD
jgi:hypothetical protein